MNKNRKLSLGLIALAMVLNLLGFDYSNFNLQNPAIIFPIGSATLLVISLILLLKK